VPITNTVSVTISPPIRVFALLGLLAATALGAFLFLVGRTADEGTQAVRPTAVTRPGPEKKPVATKAPNSAPRTPRSPSVTVQTTSGFPIPVDRALRRYKVVVVVVYMPGASVDSLVREEARAAALTSGAGYVALSALSERLVRPLVAKTGVLPDPAVVVVKRPGVVVARLSVTDHDTVAQAVTQAQQ